MLWVSKVLRSKKRLEKAGSSYLDLESEVVFLALIEYCTVILFDDLMIFELFYALRVDSPL